MDIATDAQRVYLAKISEATERLKACEYFLGYASKDPAVALSEAAVLQMRKALEAVAYAAIAPNKAAYERFRLEADRPADYRKDYNARAILQYLAKINPDFYPVALEAPVQVEPGQWHFEQKADGYLSKSKFESLYDRLGKYLHTDNPWGNGKGMSNMLGDLPPSIAQVRQLLAWHRTIVLSPPHRAVWVVEVPSTGKLAHILVGEPAGPFVVAGAGS